MKKALIEAVKDKKVAAIIIGQVIVDEGYIGTDTVVIRYNSEKIAKEIWKLANKWKWANSFQKHEYTDNRDAKHVKTAWRFSLKKDAVREIYSIIGKLPDKNKDSNIRLVIRKRKGIQRRPTITREIIIGQIRAHPSTVEDLVRKLNVCRSTVDHHLKYALKNTDLKMKVINGYGRRIYYF